MPPGLEQSPVEPEPFQPFNPGFPKPPAPAMGPKGPGMSSFGFGQEDAFGSFGKGFGS
jgi:hypothetical protein